jgi:hypothetical protein
MFFFLSFFLSFFLINTINAQKINVEEAYKIVVDNDDKISQKNVYYSP